MRKRNVVYGMFLTLAGVCLLWGSGFAVEIPEPGTYIGPDNVEKYKELIPNDGILNALRKGDRIIVAKKPFRIDPPAYVIEDTKKYAPQTKLTAEGGLSMYKGGFPFTEEEIQSETDPDRKALMAAWNLTLRWLGDDASTHYLPDAEFQLTDITEDMRQRGLLRRFCGNKYGQEVISDMRLDVGLTMGRTQMDPKPDVPGKEGILKVSHSALLNPRDVAGQHVLNYQYFDPNQNDDVWVFIPSIRRVKRMPTSQRSATRAPTDYTWDDAAAWSGKVAAFNWEYLGEPQVLGVQVISGSDTFHRKGVPLPDPADYQLVLSDTYLLSHTPKDPAYAIARRDFFVRKNSYHSLYNRLYNKRGELWKVYGTATKLAASEKLGQSGSLAAMFLVWDLPREHYTFLYPRNLSLNGYMDPNIYTVKFLYTGMRGQR